MISPMTRYFLTLMCLVVAVAVRAVDVEISAGGLAAAVPDPAAVAELRVKGTLDASDFHFIASRMDALSTLDLGEASVAAYSGEPLQGIRNFQADVLPPVLLAGTPISSITLPRGLKAIGDCALAGTRLTSLELSATLQSVGSGAFAGCRDLRTATVGCAVLGDGAFASCTALTSVTLAPAAEIGARCFADCRALAEVGGAEAVASIGDDAFRGCGALKAFAFGPQLRSIGARAFSGSGLAAADLGECGELASLGAAAFSALPSLASLTLPSVADIADARALALGSAALSEVALPVAELPAYALASDKAVAVVTLPADLEYIGDHAMAGMTGLRGIDATALKSVPELGEDVWQGVDQSAVKLKAVDKAMAEAFRGAAQWQEFDISGPTTGTDVEVALRPSVRARFAGFILQVRCEGTDVESVTVADVDGRILAVITPDADGCASLDTAQWQTEVYLLAANGPRTRATLKLIRTL